MKPRDPRETYTLRHFLFYMGVVSIVGAFIGFLASIMDWSDGLIYGVGLPACMAVAILALREDLFGPARRQSEPRHHGPGKA
jgi:hypothetical protein